MAQVHLPGCHNLPEWQKYNVESFTPCDCPEDLVYRKPSTLTILDYPVASIGEITPASGPLVLKTVYPKVDKAALVSGLWYFAKKTDDDGEIDPNDEWRFVLYRGRGMHVIDKASGYAPLKDYGDFRGPIPLPD